MKNIFFISTFLLLTSFQGERRMSIAKFVTSQFDQYELEESYMSDNFVKSIEKQNLHLYSDRILLKAKESHKNKNSYDKPVFTRIQLWQFYFENKEKCNQAIDSLLKCFPNDCAEIEKGKNQSIKVTPSIWVFCDSEIYVARTSCEHVDEKWKAFKKDFAFTFAEENSKIIVTECGKLKWTTKEEIKNAP